ncbi:MAG: hypothetical protein K2R93_21155 [Gemmatimonadaceae bacterium]|nr:hypothetical protein [Gemmatimonadaceae bacterium]
MLRSPVLVLGLLLGSLALPVAGQAQFAAPNSPVAADTVAAPAAPTTVAPAAALPRPAGLTRQTDAATLPAPKVPRASSRTNTAMMVTGLAAVLVGALVNDNDAGTVLIVGGAVVGLIGLYRFLQ